MAHGDAPHPDTAAIAALRVAVEEWDRKDSTVAPLIAENAVWRAVRALLALHSPTPEAQPDTAHEHRFSDYAICTECGQTEAAIAGCHHCNEVTPGKRCWWCLRVAEAGTPPLQPEACNQLSPDKTRPERCEMPKGHSGNHFAFGGAQIVAEWEAGTPPLGICSCRHAVTEHAEYERK
jgi:hypothetical protein